MSLPDRPRVVLTGANRGIGYHMLSALVDDGYRVAGLDVDGSNLAPLADDSPESVRYVACDVTDTGDVEDAVADVVDAWDGIDVLVNNAGVANFGRFTELPLAETRREFEVNYFGCQRTIRAALPHLRTDGGGIIHNLSSGVAIGGHPGMAGYASTKGAIEALARSLRLELHGEDVAVTLMHPPMTDTEMTRGLGWPEWMLNDPAEVGAKLAGKVESTDAVITADRQTALGLGLIRRFPSVWRRATERFVDLRR